MSTSTVKLILAFTDPEYSPDDQDKAVRNLQKQLNELDEVNSVQRVLDPSPPADNKAFGGFLVNLLLMDVSKDNFRKLAGFLSDRLSGKTIELEVEANGKKLKVKASSREELTAAIQAAQNFIAA